MPKKKTDMNEEENKKERKRMIVEEVESPKPKTEASKNPFDEIKENAEEIEELVEEVKPQIAKAETPQDPESDEKKETQEDIQKSKKTRSGVNPFWIIGPGVLILGALLGGIVVYQKGLVNLKAPTATPATTIPPEPTPTATPEAQIDLTKFSIKVLNGSGTVGEAGKVQTLLETAGFKVSNVGNAKTYDYSKTEIQAKEIVSKAFLDQLKTTLAKSYAVEGKVAILSTSSSDDVIVTVGSTSAK